MPIFGKQQPAASSQQPEACSLLLEVCCASLEIRGVELVTSLAQPMTHPSVVTSVKCMYYYNYSVIVMYRSDTTYALQ